MRYVPGAHYPFTYLHIRVNRVDDASRICILKK